ncbi:MAG: FAD-dependent oxidoreductase [Solirubrobacterales bacterium]
MALRVAIVGAGPAAFYTVEALLAQGDARGDTRGDACGELGRDVEIDIIERLPTPYGLIRAGVAPDHQSTKRVAQKFERMALEKAVRFFGNVEVGRDVSVDELRERYHAVVFAHGTSTDRKLGIPGEELPGSRSATEFVNWYNAHPDFAEREFDLSCERVVVIGNGNVAADVARMLALPRDELETTDTADHAIEAMASSGVKEIVVLGRRGPTQVAFTNPEVRELGEMTRADVIVDPADMRLDPASRAYVDSEECEPTHRRNVEIFTEFSERSPDGKPQRIVLRFCCSPVEIRGDGKVETVVVARNELVESDGRISARDTGEREEIEAGLVLRSIGYKGVPVEGVPFDERRGVIPNEAGRVTAESGEKVPGLYAVGWIKRGPSGVIGTNKKDAQETVATLFADLEAGDVPEAALARERGSIEELLAERAPDHVTYSGWEAIDAAEVAAGEPRGRPRVKFCFVEEMVEVAKSGAPA